MSECDDRFSFFFFNDTATTEIYTLSLHDALPIYDREVHRVLRGLLERLQVHVAHDADHGVPRARAAERAQPLPERALPLPVADRKSTRLNSSHANISYAVFCLKKKKHK